jgi:hypothetical protein
MAAFRDVVPCILLEDYRRFKLSACTIIREFWPKKTLLKRLLISTRLHGATSENTSSYSSP